MTGEVEIIKATILSDTTSTTALDVFTNYNPGIYDSAADVPRHVYMCLAELCTGTGKNFDELVIASYGQKITPATKAIIIQPSQTMKAKDSEYIPEDSPGAVITEIDILVSNIKTSADVTLTRDIGLRLQYILDHELRGLEDNQFRRFHTGTGPDLPITGDNTIDKSGCYKVFWVGSGTLFAAEQAHKFIARYNRAFS